MAAVTIRGCIAIVAPFLLAPRATGRILSDCGLVVEKNKGHDIREMFDGIAGRYDLLNHLLSLGIDRRWRRKAVLCLNVKAGQRILDMASGTGDVALEIARRYPQADLIVAADFSAGMLQRANAKIRRAGLGQRIFPVAARCEAIPHGDGTFDGAVIAFGIRNVADRSRGLQELRRVLRPGGKLLVLELSTPANPPVRVLYHFYFRKLLPWLAGFFSRREAYRYLPRSVADFPDCDQFRHLMEEAGFEIVAQTPMTFGIVTLHAAVRKG